MRRRRPSEEGERLWVAIVLIVIFGAAMFLSGFLVGHAYW